MANPVWVLSVDLQTKTATFQSGMADAAKSARTAFKDIRQSAMEGGEGVQQSAGNVRAALGLIDNTIRGNHAAAMADLVREFQDSRLVMLALPFAVTIGGIGAVAAIAVEVAEKVKEWREEHEKLTNETTKFGTAAQTAFNGLDDRILSAAVHADVLNNNQLAALKKQLELIDHQSLEDLAQQFENIAKKAEPLMKALEGHWYTFGIGSAGALHALQQFSVEYESLLSKGSDKEAGDLLGGTLASAEKVLAMQKQAKDSLAAQSGKAGTDIPDQLRYAEATAVLKKAGVEFTEKEIRAQQTLVDALRAQTTTQEKLAELKGLDKGNATKTTGNDLSSRAAEGARESAEHTQKMGELVLASQREQAANSASISQASIAERMEMETAAANQEYRIQLQGTGARIAALDKAGKDYNNQLKALQDHAVEITLQHENAIAAIQGKAAVAQYAKGLTDLEQSEREKINATETGSSERLAVLDSAIKDEQNRNLQNTAHYRELLASRVEAARQFAADEAKHAADAGRIEADGVLKSGQLSLAAEQQQTELRNSVRRVAIQERVAQEVYFASQDAALKLTALAHEIAALDKGGKDYASKLLELQNKQKQLIQAHENEVTQIQNRASIDRNEKYQSAMIQMETTAAQSLLSVLMGHQSFAQQLSGITQSVTQNLIAAAIAQMNGTESIKLSNAKKAATNVYGEVSGWPVVGPVLAPVMAGAAFAGVMAFEGGGIVPGVGRGDVVPAMLTPGEGVVPGGVMDGLRKMANSGEMGGSRHYQIVHKPTYHVQTINADGMKGVLRDHSEELTRFVNSQIRKMNR